MFKEMLKIYFDVQKYLYLIALELINAERNLLKVNTIYQAS